MQLSVKQWLGTTPANESEIRKQFQIEGLQPYAWSNAPGDVYSPHSHPYHKVIYVLKGSITWILPETHQEILTGPGDRLDLPPGFVHAARVGSNGVTCLEAHRE
jgi:quercetin dioxygenase-like cupin family protein